MTKPKISSKQYKATVAAARQAGGDENQSHLESRLKSELDRRHKTTTKPATRHPVATAGALSSVAFVEGPRKRTGNHGLMQSLRHRSFSDDGRRGPNQFDRQTHGHWTSKPSRRSRTRKRALQS